ERLKYLKLLSDVIKSHENAIKKALHLDLKKHPTEAYITEIFPVLNEIQLFVKKLPTWLQPEIVANGLLFVGSKAYTQLEPKGKCLIISPWNYPFQLPIIHLIACIAAGNTAIIKPSEFTPNTNEILQKIVSLVFNEDHVAVVNGDATISNHLLSFPFDHIHFTGSTKVG